MWIFPLALVCFIWLGAAASAQRLEDAVAYIRVGVTDPITQARRPLTNGSGFLIDQRGYIITARHVVMYKEREEPSPRSIMVSLGDRDAKEDPAQVVACEMGNIDLCLIKISEAAVSRANIATVFKPACRHLAPGESITAYGFPFGEANPVIRVPGEITGDLATELKYPSNVQIIPGMSGGPVVDRYGQTVAVNAAGAEGMPTITFLQPLIYGELLIRRAGLACEAARANASMPLACNDRIYRINRVLLSQNEPAPSMREYKEVVEADSGCRIVSIDPQIRSANNASYEFNVGPDGAAALIYYSLTSGPFFDRYRGWLEAELSIKQAPKQ